MAEGGKQPAGAGRLKSLIGPAAVIVAIASFGAVAAIVLSDDSNTDTAAKEVAIEVPTATPAPSAPAPSAPAPTAKPKAGKAKGANAGAAEEQTGSSAIEVCPPQATPAQCKAARESLAKGKKGSRVVPEGGPVCPKQMTKAECKQLKRSLAEGKRGSRVLQPGECATPSGVVPCEEAIRQIEAETGKPFPG